MQNNAILSRETCMNLSVPEPLTSPEDQVWRHVNVPHAIYIVRNGHIAIIVRTDNLETWPTKALNYSVEYLQEDPLWIRVA
jgi:hypothetical protein